MTARCDAPEGGPPHLARARLRLFYGAGGPVLTTEYSTQRFPSAGVLNIETIVTIPDGGSPMGTTPDAGVESTGTATDQARNGTFCRISQAVHVVGIVVRTLKLKLRVPA